MTFREKIKPYVLPFVVSALAMWGPYLVWLSVGTEIEEYVWLNLLAVPLLVPALTFPGWESFNDATVVMDLAEFIIGGAVLIDDISWQHILVCIGSIVLLAAMTTIGKRGRWWLAGVAAICVTIQVLSILALESEF